VDIDFGNPYLFYQLNVLLLHTVNLPIILFEFFLCRFSVDDLADDLVVIVQLVKSI
jgi:hypothetical protein